MAPPDPPEHVPVTCSAPDCEHSFGAARGNALVALIELHARTAHPPDAPAAATEPTTVRAEKVKRPTLTSQGTTEDWNYFYCRWGEYKAATKLAGADIVSQLLETCDDNLRRDLTRTHGSLVGESENAVLGFIKPFAIRLENVMVARVKLQSLHQERDESVRSFCARLRGQAGVCAFTKTKQCQCNEEVSVDFSEDMVRDALISGLADEDIRLHILGQANQTMTLDETLKLAEAQECGKRSAGRLVQPSDLQTSAANATSSYRRRDITQPQQQNNTNWNTQSNHRSDGQRDRARPARPTCSHCGQQGHGNGRDFQGRMKNCPAANHLCTKCNKLHHLEQCCRSSQRTYRRPYQQPTAQRQYQQQPAPATNQDAVFEQFNEQFNNAGFFSDTQPDPII